MKQRKEGKKVVRSFFKGEKVKSEGKKSRERCLRDGQGGECFEKEPKEDFF